MSYANPAFACLMVCARCCACSSVNGDAPSSPEDVPLMMIEKLCWSCSISFRAIASSDIFAALACGKKRSTIFCAFSCVRLAITICIGCFWRRGKITPCTAPPAPITKILCPLMLIGWFSISRTSPTPSELSP